MAVTFVYFRQFVTLPQLRYASYKSCSFLSMLLQETCTQLSSDEACFVQRFVRDQGKNWYVIAACRSLFSDGHHSLRSVLTWSGLRYFCVLIVTDCRMLVCVYVRINDNSWIDIDVLCY